MCAASLLTGFSFDAMQVQQTGVLGAGASEERGETARMVRILSLFERDAHLHIESIVHHACVVSDCMCRVWRRLCIGLG